MVINNCHSHYLTGNWDMDNREYEAGSYITKEFNDYK